MATRRQIKANLRNAQHSTGPQTPEGKATSRRNAATHGLATRNVLLKGEDPEEYRQLHEDLIAELKPEGVLEHEFVARIANFLWRQRRVPVFEAALLASLEQEEEKEEASFMFDFSGSPPSAGGDLKLGRTIQKFLSADFSGKLSRYEMNFRKQLSGLLQELWNMQKRRLEEAKSEKDQVKPT